MNYVNIPKKISLNALHENGFCFAPSKYSSFYPDDEKRFSKLGQVVKLRNERIKIENHEEYIYVEIGDINVNTGSIEYNKYLGVNMPTSSPIRTYENDILISTVRTYRKGIALVKNEFKNISCTPAILVISDTKKSLTKEYVFAVVRTDFFVEQILSFQNRGMYPRLDTDTIDHVYIPLPRSRIELEYVTYLQKSLLNKEIEIRKKIDLINHIIETEIGFNVQGDSNTSYPTVTDLKNIGRLDTGPYTGAYKSLDSKIRNYKNGSQTFKQLGYEITRGQNLQVSNIGRSIYSERYQKGFYKLLLSKHLTERMTVETYEYLGNPKNLKTIKKGDIIFSCRGDLGRVFVSCEEMNDTITNIDNVHIRNPQLPIEHKIVVGAFLNYLRISGYLSGASIQGSGADSFTIYHFDTIQIPNFNTEIQQEIADLYFNKHLSMKIPDSTDNFLRYDEEWSKNAGIFQLSKSIKLTRDQLAKTIDNIINNRKQDISFEFYF